MVAMGVIMGGHVRVGLEDNIFVRRRVLATNVGLVEKAKRIAAEFEREIATPDEAREMLGLKGKDAVNF
jgi:3-keto-5-aminohexanoate cleavage enzyme